MATSMEPLDKDQLTVQYWREKLDKLLPPRPQIKLADIVERLAKVDPYYEGRIGYSRLQNIVNHRGGLAATARLVGWLLVFAKEDGPPKRKRRADAHLKPPVKA